MKQSLPSLAYSDGENSTPSHLKAFSQMLERSTFVKEFSDKKNFFIGQLRKVVFLSVGLVKVVCPSSTRILQIRHVLKILQHIVRLIAIFMVEHIARWTWTHKCPSYKLMDEKFPMDSILGKADPIVPVATNGRLTNSIWNMYGFMMGAAAPRAYTSKSALIADFVQTFKAENRLPNFSGRISIGHVSLLSRLTCQEP